MSKNRLLFCLIFLSFIYSKKNYEELVYKAQFRNITAGESIFKHYKNDNPALYDKVVFELKTNKLLDFIYIIRDKIKLELNHVDYSLNKIIKNSRQSRKIKHHHATVDYESGLINFKNGTLKITNKIYDPISIIYFLRNQSLYIGREFVFNSYNNGKIKKVRIKITDEETITSPIGSYPCYVITPSNDELLKEDEIMKLWISKKPPYLPIKIEKNSKNGIIKLLLKKINNDE